MYGFSLLGYDRKFYGLSLLLLCSLLWGYFGSFCRDFLFVIFLLM